MIEINDQSSCACLHILTVVRVANAFATRCTCDAFRDNQIEDPSAFPTSYYLIIIISIDRSATTYIIMKCSEDEEHDLSDAHDQNAVYLYDDIRINPRLLGNERTSHVVIASILWFGYANTVNEPARGRADT